MQQRLKEQLGILLDMVKQGSGNTNNGNIARRFSKNINVISRVLGEIFYFKSNFNYALFIHSGKTRVIFQFKNYLYA